jgi:ectoine hydroxylase-related dioxygenase (phytanoyl-CoA dioxygenase family)
MPKVKADKRSSKFAWQEFSVNFEPGLLVLFPSYLHHSVPVNKSNSVRCSLAFNIVPTTGFGEEESLTELLF